jgi:polyhydroxybutyrate depolymerase
MADNVELVDSERGFVNLYLPDTIEESEKLPLIVSLHGYSSSGSEHENYFRFRNEIDEKRFMLCVPDATQNFLGTPFWNATDACCNFLNKNVDDSGYLRSLIEKIISEYNVDIGSIHVVGHSNGGFMSHRMACDHADLITSVASLAGMNFLNANLCTPEESIHVLQIHGDGDTVIRYAGGCIGNCYPSAVETVETWAQLNGCEPSSIEGTPLNLVNSISGSETSVLRYTTSCEKNGSSELWTVEGGDHGPSFNANFRRDVISWLLTHRRDDPATCSGDINGDLIVDGADLTTLLSGWGTESDGDLNGDGNTDGLDVAIILSDWGSC